MSREIPSRVPLKEGHGPSFLGRLVERNGGVLPRTYGEVMEVCERVETARAQGLAPAKLPAGREGARQGLGTGPGLSRGHARIFRNTPGLEACFPVATPWHDPPLQGGPPRGQDQAPSHILDEFDREASEVLEGYASLVESDADTATSVLDDSNWENTRRGLPVEEEWDQRAEAERQIWELREAEAKEGAAREREERIRLMVMRRREKMRSAGGE